MALLLLKVAAPKCYFFCQIRLDICFLKTWFVTYLHESNEKTFEQKFSTKVVIVKCKGEVIIFFFFLIFCIQCSLFTGIFFSLNWNHIVHLKKYPDHRLYFFPEWSRSPSPNSELRYGDVRLLDTAPGSSLLWMFYPMKNKFKIQSYPFHISYPVYVDVKDQIKFTIIMAMQVFRL